jgi:hypothetical protein
MFTLACPVCNGRTITVYGNNDDVHSAKCNDCGTFDALHKFEAATLKTGSDFDPLSIFPPDEIVQAMYKLRDYFVRDRGAKQWAFGYVQSRDEPALIGIEHVRNMAAAFRMHLVARPDREAFADNLKDWLAQAILSPMDQNQEALYLADQITTYLFPATKPHA